MYEVYAKLRDSKGMKDSEVAMLADIRQGILSDWKNGKSTPSTKNLQKIAYVLNTSTDYLLTGKLPEKYYLNDETAKLAQEIYDNPSLRALMDAGRDASAFDLQMLTHMLKRLKETNPDEL